MLDESPNSHTTAQSMLSTKIAWSFAHHNISADLADLVMGKEFDALRLVYFPNVENRIAEFLQAIHSKDKRVPIILDVALKIRATVAATDNLAISMGDVIKLIPATQQGETPQGAVLVASNEWGSLFKAKASIHIGSDVELKCLEVNSNHVVAQVIQGEHIPARAVIRVPSTYMDSVAADIMSPAMDEFLAHGLDFVVVPGMTSPDEILKLRNYLRQASKSQANLPWLVVKVDSYNIYEHLPQVIDAVDGVLISRRELALTTQPATVPMLAKEVIKTCAEHAKFTMTASELLASMRTHSSPTRAEVSDIANAVIDGTDVIVMPEELTDGELFLSLRQHDSAPRPQDAANSALSALRYLRSVIADVEKNVIEPNWHPQEPTIKTEYDALTATAYRTAHRVGAKAIVCLTNHGETAMRLSRFRSSTPIIAVVFDSYLLNRLCLLKGVQAIHVSAQPSLDEILPVIAELLKSEGYLNAGDMYIFVSISLSPLGKMGSNLFTVQKV